MDVLIADADFGVGNLLSRRRRVGNLGDQALCGSGRLRSELVEVSISARHGSISPDAQEYIEKKLPKLSHLFDRLTSIRVTVDFQRPEPEIELLVSAEHKHDFVACERHTSVEAAFDNVIAKMEGQLRKYKTKVQDHHRRSPGSIREAGDIAAGEESSA